MFPAPLVRSHVSQTKHSIWSAAAFVLALLSVCGATTVSAQELEVNTDAQWVAKLDAYVDCINFHGNWTLQSRDRYFSWMKSPEKGPTGREEVVYGLYELRDPADCRAGIDDASERPPDDVALESAAEAFVASLERARIVVGEAYTYYELGDWQDDKMHQGKALHPKLVAAFEDFAAADRSLRARVDELQTELAERRLQRLAADSENRDRYIVERMAYEAERMLDHAAGMGDKQFAQDAFEAAVTDYEAAWREYDSFAKANPKHPNAAISSSVLGYNALDLLKCAKSAMRQAKKGFRFTEGERMLIEANAAQMVDGHPAQLVDKYNRLIDALNSARR